MRKMVLVAILMLANSSLAIADSNDIALKLGTVIAAEKFCGFDYDQKAIENYIEKNVPASDMNFPSTLQLMVDGTAYNHQNMSKSAKTAHCFGIKRTAKHYKFIK